MNSEAAGEDKSWIQQLREEYMPQFKELDAAEIGNQALLANYEDAQEMAQKQDETEELLELISSIKSERDQRRQEIDTSNPIDTSWAEIKSQFKDSDGPPKKEILHEIALKLVDEADFKSMRDNGRLWIFNGIVYESEAEQRIQQELQHKLGPHLSDRDIKEVINKVTHLCYEERSYEKHPRYIPVENGWYDLEEQSLTSPKPELFITSQIPVTYDPEADCPNIKQFVEDVVDGEDVELVQELVGYTLYRDYLDAHAFMLHGSGSNGKSVLIDLISRFLGRKNVSSITLHKLNENRFAPAQLQDKLANLHDDLSNQWIKNSDTFRNVTGGGLVDAEIKHEGSFNFRNHAKLVYAANTLPGTKVTTDAFFRRWIIIDFPYKFVDNPSRENEKQRQSDIIEDLTTDEELSGLLNWALEGLHRILERDENNEDLFTTTDNREEIKEKWLAETNPIEVFLDRYCEFEQGVEVRKSDFRDALNDFAADKGSNKDYGLTQITKELKSKGVSAKRARVDNERIQVYEGVKVVGEYGEEVRVVRGNSNVSRVRDGDQSSIEEVPNTHDHPDQESDSNRVTAEERVKEAIRNVSAQDSEHEGATYGDVIDAVNLDESEVEDVIDDGLHTGKFYKPKPGRVVIND